MGELVIKVEVPQEIMKEFKIALASVVREVVERTKLEAIKSKLNTKEEQEFIKWSVDLGREAKKESFKKILSKLSPEERKSLSK